jgi:hypothetical protein
MSDRIQLRYNPVIAQWDLEAEAMGIGLPVLLTADLKRLREIIPALAPQLTDWERQLIEHVMPPEGNAMLLDRGVGEQIVSADRIRIGIMEWADGADQDQMLKAEDLARRAATWSDTERWALMILCRPRSQ